MRLVMAMLDRKLILIPILLSTLAAVEAAGPTPLSPACKTLMSRVRFLSAPAFDFPKFNDHLYGLSSPDLRKRREVLEEVVLGLVRESRHHEIFPLYWSLHMNGTPYGEVSDSLVLDDKRSLVFFTRYAELRTRMGTIFDQVSKDYPGVLGVIESTPRSWKDFFGVYDFFQGSERFNFAVQPVQGPRAGIRVAIDSNFFKRDPLSFQTVLPSLLASLKQTYGSTDWVILPENLAESGAIIPKTMQNVGEIGQLAFSGPQSESDLSSIRALAANISRIRKRIQPDSSPEVIGDDRLLAQMALASAREGVTHFFTNDNPMINFVLEAREFHPERDIFTDAGGRYDAVRVDLADPFRPEIKYSYTIVAGDRRRLRR